MRATVLSSRTLRRVRYAIAASALVAGSAACPMRPEAAAANHDNVATLSIINHHPLDVVIYNVRQGHRERIGDVTAATNRTFTLHLRQYPGNELQLSADPVGSVQPFTSQVIHVLAGETVEWTLETELARSFVVVR